MNYQEISAATGLVLVEIDGTGVEHGRTYTDKATGAQKPLPGRQTAYIWQGGKYPVEVSLDYPDSAGAYRPGFYFLGGAVFASGDYGRVNWKGSRELKLVSADELFDRLGLSAPGAKKAA